VPSNQHTETRSSDRRWDCLQYLLANLQPGESVTVNDIAARTGLGVDSVDTVLQALTRAELFSRANAQTFIRQRLWMNCDR